MIPSIRKVQLPGMKKLIKCIICDGTKINPDNGEKCKECDDNGEMTVIIMENK